MRPFALVLRQLVAVDSIVHTKHREYLPTAYNGRGNAIGRVRLSVRLFPLDLVGSRPPVIVEISVVMIGSGR